MSKIKPITPEEARNDAKSNIPEFVIIGVNNAIKNHYHKSGFTIKQKDILAEIMKNAPENMTSDEIFENNFWLFLRIDNNAFRANVILCDCIRMNSCNQR